LDELHGPYTGGCTNCRGVVTINSLSGAVTRNVEYYALAHASRFVKPGARRIGSTPALQGLENVAFRNPDSSTVVIVVNAAAEERRFAVRWTGQGLVYTLPKGAVATFRFGPRRERQPRG
jgi:glucosylceramidase